MFFLVSKDEFFYIFFINLDYGVWLKKAVSRNILPTNVAVDLKAKFIVCYGMSGPRRKLGVQLDLVHKPNLLNCYRNIFGFLYIFICLHYMLYTVHSDIILVDTLLRRFYLIFSLDLF